MVVLAAVALVGCVLLLRGGEGRTELVGASDFNSVSGQTHVFWGEDPELHVGRYPPEYARQMKQMRLLMKRLKQTNLESKELMRQEQETIREIKREMENIEEDADTRLGDNVRFRGFAFSI